MTLSDKIYRLRKERNAIILAHNYVDAEIQNLADFVGDSLELSLKAKKINTDTDADADKTSSPIIVFCGVSFMAETAKILSPESIVLTPTPSAGCPMADMVTADKVRKYRETNPDTVLVAYVNSTAAVKAEVDICCTSANAERIVRSIPKDKRIMFLPDQNLGANIRNKLGRDMALWPGFCPTHNKILPDAAKEIRTKHKDAILLVHPECTPSVVALADEALSTGGMLKYVKESPAKQFIIGTESGILYRMREENPDKTFIPLAPEPICPDMKKITLEDVCDALEYMQHEVKMDYDLIECARTPIEKMLAVK